MAAAPNLDPEETKEDASDPPSPPAENQPATTGTQMPTQAPANAPTSNAPSAKLSTHVSPWDANFDPSSKAGLQLFQSAVKPPGDWTPVAVTPENRTKFLAAIRWMTDKYSISLLTIPTSGTGNVADEPKRLVGRDVANYDLADFRDALDEHVSRIADDIFLKYSGWIWGGDSSKFEAASDMVAVAIDPNLPGNRGLVNVEKMKLRRESFLLFQYLTNLIDYKDFTSFRLAAKQYTYALEENPRQSSKCGIILFSKLLERIQPSNTKISTENLEEDLESLKLADFDMRLDEFFAAAKDLRRRIVAEKGRDYDEDKYMSRLFDQMATHRQEDFISDMRASKRAWEKGSVSAAEARADLLTSYTNLIAKKKWKQLDPRGQQIIALTTRVDQLQKRVKDADTALKSAKAGAKADGNPKSSAPGGAKRTGAPEWQIKYAGAQIKHPDHDFEMVWCKEHKSKDGKVNGMYMKVPHDHEKWKADK